MARTEGPLIIDPLSTVPMAGVELAETKPCTGVVSMAETMLRASLPRVAMPIGGGCTPDWLETNFRCVNRRMPSVRATGEWAGDWPLVVGTEPTSEVPFVALLGGTKPLSEVPGRDALLGGTEPLSEVRAPAVCLAGERVS